MGARTTPTTHRLNVISTRRHLPRQAKVAQLEHTEFIDEHVGWLEVAVQDARRVHVVEACHEIHTKDLGSKRSA